MSEAIQRYGDLLADIKAKVRGAQIRAALSASRHMLALYWDIGRLIQGRQREAGWGAGVLTRLATDLKTELPEVKGFSERNLKRMTQYFRAYPSLAAIHGLDRQPDPIGPQPVAQLGASTAGQARSGVALDIEAGRLSLELPWGHNILLLQKVEDLPTRLWYMRQTLAQGWSRDVLGLMIKSDAHTRQGAATTNFEERLPAPQSDLAQQTLKDPYLFDFLTLDEPFREHELELGLVRHLEAFLLELGVGFAFVGRQHHLSVGDDDFYLDLLFYHLTLRCFVVEDLKVGPFRPDHAGKMNFYLNVVDDTLRHEHDNPTIGLILCQDKKQVLAEYALRGLDKPIGVSEYELTRALPESLESALPTIEQIEAELTAADAPNE